MAVGTRLDVTVKTIGENNPVKTKRQANYYSATAAFRHSAETPFSVGLYRYIRQQAKINKAIKTSDLHTNECYKLKMTLQILLAIIYKRITE